MIQSLLAVLGFHAARTAFEGVKGLGANEERAAVARFNEQRRFIKRQRMGINFLFCCAAAGLGALGYFQLLPVGWIYRILSAVLLLVYLIVRMVHWSTSQETLDEMRRYCASRNLPRDSSAFSALGSLGFTGIDLLVLACVPALSKFSDMPFFEFVVEAVKSLFGI